MAGLPNPWRMSTWTSPGRGTNRLIAQARSRSAAGFMGTHGPRDSDLRAGPHVCWRDPRFRVASRHCFLARPRHHLRPVVGFASPPNLNQFSGRGRSHHRLRRLVAERRSHPGPPQRLHTTIGRRHHRTGRAAPPAHGTVCERLSATHFARQYPIPIICALPGRAARGLEAVLRLDRRQSSRRSAGNAAAPKTGCILAAVG